jgi:DnaJ-class molecular chaperone
MNNRELLGVGADANKADIKQAFRKAAKEYHPDLSDSPEAAEAFTRIKEAHDALIKEVESSRESATVSASAAHASAATARTMHFAQTTPSHITDEQLAHIQELDALARAAAKRSLFRRNKEPDEVRKHRKKLKTNERRLRGLY